MNDYRPATAGYRTRLTDLLGIFFFSGGKGKMEQKELLKAMQNPDFYPERPDRVDVVETHISTLFLTDRFVYKVKKPVNFGFLDFTSLSAREYFCEQELFLNQRLSSNVYLAVSPIYQAEEDFSLEPQGKIVEYAVQMRRLPEDRMMETLLRKGEIDEEVIKQIAFHLIGFHSRARTDPEISIYGTASRISKNTEENFLQTKPFLGITLDQKQYDRISGYTRVFMNHHRPLFQKRTDEKKIRDCHGDIRMEHICIEDQIVIFDCVEFNRRFRYSDVAADIAFLAMDLDFHQAPHLSHHLLRTYVDYTHDIDLLKLIRFYKCYRAYVRGKVESFKGNDSSLTSRERENALSLARRYFALSDSYTQRNPCLIITSGLTGVGKSRLADTLAEDLDMALFQSDRIRKKISGVPPKEHHHEPFGKGIYSKEVTCKTYQTLLLRAEAELQKRHPVILDATFLKEKERKEVQDFADQMNVPFFMIEVICPEEEVKKRLFDRILQLEEPSDGRWEIYLSQKKIQDPVAGISSERHFLIDTAKNKDLLFEVEKKILLDIEA
jgi:aminoglycoside phosphotransferase family enzyme/predicted kinase